MSGAATPTRRVNDYHIPPRTLCGDDIGKTRLPNLSDSGWEYLARLGMAVVHERKRAVRSSSLGLPVEPMAAASVCTEGHWALLAQSRRLAIQSISLADAGFSANDPDTKPAPRYGGLLVIVVPMYVRGWRSNMANRSLLILSCSEGFCLTIKIVR